MEVFKVEGQALKEMRRAELPDERYLQRLVEANLLEILGARFVASEYVIPNGRIDTLALDDSFTPVVIEYKKRQDPGAIIQGLFYVDWLNQNRRTFEMLVREKLGAEAVVDWSSGIRLVILAEAFDPKELSAINLVRTRVELMKHSFYGDMLAIDSLSLPGTGRVDRDRMQQSGPNGEEDEGQDSMTLEGLLEKASPTLQGAIKGLRDLVLQLGDDVEESYAKTQIRYVSGGKGLAWFQPSKRSFVIYLRGGHYDDPKARLKPGKGYAVIYQTTTVYENDADIEYLAGLLRQAYAM